MKQWSTLRSSHLTSCSICKQEVSRNRFSLTRWDQRRAWPIYTDMFRSSRSHVPG